MKDSKYEEALERARAGKPIDEVFPELKESEDERIRKTLLRCCDDWEKGQSSCVTKKDVPAIRAYLERLKGQKPIEWSDSVAKEMFIKALERAVEQTKKGYELTDCDKHSWWEDFKAYSGIKPAEWSEEDKSILNNIIAYKYLNIDDLEWLKSLPERFNLQPKQEWSEEDKRKIVELKTFIAQCNGFNKENRKKAFDMIDAIRPQPHWKPSEEQMDALKYALGKGGSYNKEALDSLLIELQKLL